MWTRCPPFLAATNTFSQAQHFLDCHLMVSNPAQWVKVRDFDLVTPLHPHTHSTAPGVPKRRTALPSTPTQEYGKAGADMYTFHLEAVVGENPQDTTTPDSRVVDLIHEIKAAGMHVGIALKPATRVEAVFPYCDQGLLDMVLVLSVEPGFGGQKFMEGCMPKARGGSPKAHCLVLLWGALPQAAAPV